MQKFKLVIMKFINRLHLGWLFIWALKSLPRVRKIRSRKSPIYFLGEQLYSRDKWDKALRKAIDQAGPSSSKNVKRLGGSFGPPTISGSEPLAAVICSLYRCEEYLPSFLRNLEGQSIFGHLEVYLVLVEPTELEATLLRKFAEKHPNVEIEIFETRITIYEAWNVAISKTSAPLITNMNVDDIRHSDSLRIQCYEMLDSPEIDVVYQDVYYVYQYLDEWEIIESIGLRSSLPDVTTSLLASGINAPHNAPMWRRSLHGKIGQFDEKYLSAADHDFWIRASSAGAVFKKSSHIHVAYYINPEGMSTKANSPGRTEGAAILARYSNLV